MIAKALKRIWIMAVCLTALAASALAVDAASDPVGYTVEQMSAFSSSFQVPVTEFDQLMYQVLEQEPRLFYYVTGCSYTMDQGGITVTMGYQNTDIPMEDIWVVDSQEQLYSAIGLAEYENSSQVRIIATGDFADEAGIQAAFDTLNQDYYLLAMPYHGDYYTYSRDENFGTGLISLDITLIFWDGVDAQTAAQWKDETEAAVLQLSKTLFAQDMPDWMKEYLIHDYLVDNNRYDSYTPDASVRHVAYSALCEGSTVCQGYTEAARLLLEAAGIPSYYVTGEAGGGDHGWNCVQLDGSWYMLDITWDDPVTTDGSDVKQYTYFNVTSAQLAQDHSWDTASAPECTDTALNGDAVYALLSEDQGGYSDYSDRLVRTQQIQHDELMGNLGLMDQTEAAGDPDKETTAAEDAPEGTELAPDGDDQTAADTAEGTQPEDARTDPDEDMRDVLGVVPELPDFDDEEESAGGFRIGTAVMWLIVLLLAGGLAVLLTRMTASRRMEAAREERREFRIRRLRSSSQRGRSFRS